MRSALVRKLKENISTDTTIVCSNCFAGRVYQDLKWRYTSPTIGLFFPAEDYNIFLERFKEMTTTAKLTFIEESRYDWAKEIVRRRGHSYPIGLLGGIVEVHFLHYSSKEEATKKWAERCKRINYNKLIVIGMEQNGCSIDDIKTFDSLPFKQKIFYSTKHMPACRSNCLMPQYKNEVGDAYHNSKPFFERLLYYLENEWI